MPAPFPLIPGESFNGGVARWASENGADRMIDVTHVAGVQHAHRQHAAHGSVDQMRCLADETGIPLADLVERALPLAPDDDTRRLFNGISMPRVVIDGKRRLFSPASLRALPFHRASWGLKIMPFCPESWEYLRDRCGEVECGTLGWTHTIGLHLCDHCTSDLRDLTADLVPEAERPALEKVARLVGNDPHDRQAVLRSLGPELRNRSANAVANLLIKLLGVANTDMPSKLADMMKRDAATITSSVVKAWRLIEAWPAGLIDLCAGDVRHSLRSKRPVSVLRLQKLLSADALHGAQTEVADILQALRRSITPSASRTSNVVTVKTAAKIIGRGSAKVSAMRRDGVLSSRLAYTEFGLITGFDRTELEHVRTQMRSSGSIKNARIQLGMSRFGIEELIDLGYVEAFDHPIFDTYTDRQCDLRSIQNLINVITMRGSASGCGIPLGDAVKAVGARIKPWGALFEAMLDGAIDYLVDPSPGPLTRRIRVNRRGVAIIQSLAPPSSTPSFMTKIDAEEMLNLGPKQTIAALINVPAVPGRDTMVPFHIVEEMTRRHITCSEIAMRLGISTMAARGMAARKGLSHSASLGFFREEAERLLFVE
jgi:hypothetical protein